MPYKRPDVYIEELPGISTKAEISTSIAGFIGKSKRGIPNTPILCETWSDFVDNFAGGLNTPFMPTANLAYAVYGFFQNGGSKVYVNRVVGANSAKANVVMPSDGVAVTFTAIDDGVWANNHLQVEVEGRSETGFFNVYVYLDGEVVESHLYVTNTTTDINYYVGRINGKSAYVTASVGELKDSTTAQVETATVAGDVTVGGDITVTVTAAGLAGSPKDYSVAVLDTDTNTQIATKIKNVLLADSALTALYTPSSNGADIILTKVDPAANDETLNIALTNDTTTGLTPVVTSTNTTFGIGSHLLTGGSDGDDPSNLDYVNGLSDFDNVLDVNILCMPDGINEVTAPALLAYTTARNDCFAIIDPIVGHGYTDAVSFKDLLDGKCGAYYFPCIKVSDPLSTTNTLRTIPPSGHIAGIYSRIDSSRGVHKSPGGVECNIRGAVALEVALTNAQVGELNDIHVNCLINKNGSLVVWGVRTLTTDQDSMYVGDVRFDQYIRDLCYADTTFAVFEPNDPVLWNKMVAALEGILHNQWLLGAKKKKKKEQAYFVKCDAELNPVAVQERGECIAEIGYAKKTPAEFIIVRIRQMAAQSY